MIFVIVGTHEQPFDRLIRYMDKWAEDHDEEVVIQTGYSSYEPENCTWQNMFPYQEMIKRTNEARIVITHGGPASFMTVMQSGRIPVVVPRKAEFKEQVNDHQVEFCRQVAQRQGGIIVVWEIDELGDIIERYDEICAEMEPGLGSNNKRFCDEFEKIVDDLMRS